MKYTPIYVLLVCATLRNYITLEQATLSFTAATLITAMFATKVDSILGCSSAACAIVAVSRILGHVLPTALPYNETHLAQLALTIAIFAVSGDLE